MFMLKFSYIFITEWRSVAISSALSEFAKKWLYEMKATNPIYVSERTFQGIGD